MPIVVSGLNVEKLLSIPKLPASTGELTGNAVVEVLQQWQGVPEWLAGLCFDTTSSNTGVHNGAITVIQQKFDKRLLFLACRHHILEVVSSAVFDHFFSSSGLKIALFGRFKEYWSVLDLKNFAPLLTEASDPTELSDSEKQWLQQSRNDATQFPVSLLTGEAQPHHDYMVFC